MNRAAILLGFAILFISSPVAFAKISNSIEISNNGDNSTNRVEVKSNTSSSNSKTENDCRTEIRIESNGETKEHISDDCENVAIESSNGNNSVKINNSSEKTIIQKDSADDDQVKPTAKPTKTITPTATQIDEKDSSEENDPAELSVIDIFLTMGKRFFGLFSLN